MADTNPVRRKTGQEATGQAAHTATDHYIEIIKANQSLTGHGRTGFHLGFQRIPSDQHGPARTSRRSCTPEGFHWPHWAARRRNARRNAGRNARRNARRLPRVSLGCPQKERQKASTNYPGREVQHGPSCPWSETPMVRDTHSPWSDTPMIRESSQEGNIKHVFLICYIQSNNLSHRSF